MLNTGAVADPWLVCAALLAVLGAALLALRTFGRVLPQQLRGPGPGPLRIAGVVAVDGRRRLYLISTGDVRALLMTGGPADQLITLPGNEPPPP